MEWRVQLVINKNLDPLLIKDFFTFLESNGVKYNAGNKGKSGIEGKYYINCRGSHEEDKTGSNEKISDIITTYLTYDLSTTSLSVYLDNTNEVVFPFNVSVHQLEEDKSLFFFGGNDYKITNEQTFLTFIKLCKMVFVKFNFIYGSFRNEYQDDAPYSIGNFLKESPDIVNFYSKLLVDMIGRDKLLSTPAYKVEELENGNVMLMICATPTGCEDLEKAGYHLGFNGYTG